VPGDRLLQHEQRRLAAILAADVVGYSRLMAADEAGTLARLARYRAEVIEPKIAEFRGRIVGSASDSLLVEFASAVGAVRCAVEAQAELAGRNAELPEDRRMVFRMGVNLGDVIAAGDTIHGDGVNIAARLEKLAEPGGVCIGRNVHDQVKSKLGYGYADLGEQRLHNIPEPVRAFRVYPSQSAAGAVPAAPKAALPLPAKPSIAVLPFQNLSGDAEQEYFADGMVEEIITALSRVGWLFVIARNSSFAYKGRAVDLKQVGRELGVRYILEGSVRKAGNKVRITGQLIDSATGGHLWADRFDGALEDIFDLQDRVTGSVVGAISPKLEQAEIERSQRKPTESLDAYDYYLRGVAAAHEWSRDANEEALAHFLRAIELDPNFASAYGQATRCYSRRKSSGWVVDGERDIAETARLAARAAALGGSDAIALCTAGFSLGHVVGDVEGGDAMIERALALNPNLAIAWGFSAWAKVWLGEPATAIECAERAVRLSPQDPRLYSMQCAIAYAHFLAGRDDEAVSWAEKSLRVRPDYGTVPTRIVAAGCAYLGRRDAAAKAMARLRALDPGLRVANLRDLIPLRRPEDQARLAEGLKKAGLPD
jgi:TolB-like protein/class 3 adenylate cyclase